MEITSARVLPPEEMETALELDRVKKEIEVEDDKKDNKNEELASSHTLFVGIFDDLSQFDIF